MTFQPALPAVVLIAVAVVVIAMRLLTMRRLYASAGGRWSTVLRWSGLTLAALLILIAAARPGVEHGEHGAGAGARTADNTNVFFIVDRSPDSAVEDHAENESRMSAIRNDIEALIDQRPGARFAMIAFASRASLDWPLSEDGWSLRPEVARLTPYAASADAEDVNAAAAANVLRYQLIGAGQQYPGSNNLIYYFGSGAAGSRAPQGEFDPTAGTVDGGAVFGYGAGQNEQGLRTVAEQLGVPYFDRDNGRPIAEAAPSGTSTQPAAGSPQASGTAGRTELYWVFTVLASVLLQFELFASIRDIRRTRLARRDVAL